MIVGIKDRYNGTVKDVDLAALGHQELGAPLYKRNDYE